MRKKQMILNSIYKMNTLKGLHYLMAVIVFGTAPTIHSIKPSSLLTITSRKNLLDLWIKNQDFIVDFLNVDVFYLREGEDSCSILFYKEENLKKQLQRGDVKESLENMGYDNHWFHQLEDVRKKYTQKFPHEIGLFLGIPPADVVGFIQNKGKNYLLNGYWKVYENVTQAVETFRQYDEARLDGINYLMNELVHLNPNMETPGGDSTPVETNILNISPYGSRSLKNGSSL